jgi:tetratricopeptide (TPR) repeat protein
MMNIQDPNLECYRQLIDNLKQRKQPIDKSQALEILTARDALQIALEREKPVPIDVLDEVIQLDTRFQANAIRLTGAINKNSAGELARWRKSVKPSAEAWWWRLESIESPTDKRMSDWVWKTLSFGIWAANISLLVNIASRFGGAGAVGFFDPLPVIIPAIGAIVSAGNKIPTFESLLKRIGIPKYNLETTKFFGTVAVFLVLIGGSNVPPDLSKWANSDGLEKFDDGDFSGAEKEYKKSISLDGNNIDAHYNLGNLYEVWMETANAKKQYQMGVAHKFPKAYNNLGRLYIIEKKYPQAASLLVRGLEEAKNNNSSPATKYSLYKNLGWVRLKQERYPQAKEALKQAIDISGNPANKESIHNPGAAHCLLAQTLDKLKQPEAETIELQKCSRHPPQPDKFDPDEDTWHDLATQKLANPKTPKEPNAKLPKVK